MLRRLSSQNDLETQNRQKIENTERRKTKFTKEKINKIFKQISLSLRIQSKSGKIRTRITPN